jgi:Spy/CpxP family protein refolding chaperone
MKRFLVALALTIIALGATAALVSADGPPPASPADLRAGGRGLRHLERCLSTLGLSSDQKAAVEEILSAAQPALQASVEALRAGHERIRADVANGADKCIVGQDVLDQNANRTKLRNEMQTVRDQILAKLTPDQQNGFNACAQAPGARHRACPGKI